MQPRFPSRMTWLAMLLTVLSASVHAAPRQDATLLNATQVLTDLQEAPDQNVPNWLLDRAYAVAVIPNVLKIGLFAGGRRGSGVMVVRQPDLTWSNPVFVNITSVSLGLQWGVQSSDLLLVFTSRASVEGIIGGKVTLGADASVAAGPVGRQAAAATDTNLTAQVYAYARNKGLFIGVALDGSALTISQQDNEGFYGKPGVLASEIIAPNAAPAPSQVRPFIAALATAPAAAATPPAPNVNPSTPAPAASTNTVPAAVPNNNPSGLVTYPMEDTRPGTEPPP